MITSLAEIRASFDKEGVINIGKILDSEEVDLYKKRLLDIFRKKNNSAARTVANLSETALKKEKFITLQLINIHKQDASFLKIIKHPKLLKHVKNILGSDIKLFRDQAFFKPSYHGGEIFMHQDNRYWHLTSPKAVVVWIALDDATTENGCVHYIRGSHKKGRFEHQQAQNGNSVQLEALCDKNHSVPYPVKKGMAILHDCQTVHWSPQNASPKGRLSFTIAYMAAGVKSKKYPNACYDID